MMEEHPIQAQEREEKGESGIAGGQMEAAEYAVSGDISSMFSVR
jgi:5-enolpyruvylshikimate-3-phosphate synthase